MTTASDLDRELEQMANEELRNPGSTSSSSSSSASSSSTGAPRSSYARASSSSSSSSPLPRVDVLAPLGHVSDEDKNLAVVTHGATIAAAVFSGGFLDIAVPAVAYVLFKDRSQFLKDHVKHQLNFQLTALSVALIGAAIAALTFGIGLIVAIPAVLFFFVVDIVASIKAAIAASRGEQYRFPFAFDFLK